MTNPFDPISKSETPRRVVILRATPVAPDPRAEKIARTLMDAGYIVRLVGWDMQGAYPKETNEDGLSVIRLQVKAEFGRGLGNIRHQIRWQAALLVWLIHQHRSFDILHACDFDTVLPALICQRFFGVKVIYDIFDFYAEMLRATPRSVVQVIRRVDLLAMNQADAVILADDSRRQQILGAHPRKLTVIYNCLDEIATRVFNTPPSRENAKPPTAQELPNPKGSVEPSSPPTRCAGELHIAYVGNLQVERGLLFVLNLLQRHPEWTLDLAGFGGDEKLIQQAAQALPNVTFHGRVPYERALRLSQSADVLFATYDPAIPNNRYASPNKVFEAMMLGKPILVARGTNMDQIITQADCGVVVEYGNQAELETAFCHLADEPAIRRRLGENARHTYETTYNWQKMRDRLLHLYREVMPGDFQPAESL